MVSKRSNVSCIKVLRHILSVWMQQTFVMAYCTFSVLHRHDSFVALSSFFSPNRVSYIGGSRGGWGGGGGGAGGWTLPPEKSQKYRVSYQYWSGSRENHKATKPALNVGPSLARQRSAISMAFHWRADEGPFIAVFVSSIPLSTKKERLSNLNPL